MTNNNHYMCDITNVTGNHNSFRPITVIPRRSKRVASQYQIDDHASSSLKAIFHCGRFARAGRAINFNHVKNQSRGHVKQVECSSTFMACPRAFKRTKNAKDRQLQRKLSNVRFARAGKATAMENCLNVLRCYLRSATDQYLFTYSHSDP